MCGRAGQGAAQSLLRLRPQPAAYAASSKQGRAVCPLSGYRRGAVLMAGPDSTYVYVDTALGALNRRNHVVRWDDVDYENPGAERYISHRRATADLVEWTRTHVNANGNATVEGYDGLVWDASLPFDFDDKVDPAHALVWVRRFLDRMDAWEVPLDALRVYFSGAKGFHLEIPHTLFGGFEPSDQLHTYERHAALELMADIPFDTSVYDKLRLWRLTNTFNTKGQRYKVQLSIHEVTTRSMPEILDLALKPRPRSLFPTAPAHGWNPNEFLVEVWQRAQGVGVTPEPQAPTWSDEEHSRVFLASIQAAIAASWPHNDPRVSRHTDYLLPLSGYLAKHMPAAAVSMVLKEAARWAGDSGFLEDRTRHWEDEIDRLAEDSARRIATGQPCAGLPTVVKHWPELAEVLSTSFVDRTSTPKPGSAAAKVKGFTLTGLATALEEPPEVTAYVVDGMFPVGGVSLIGAKPKVGKSVLVRNLAMSVARGEPFLDRVCVQGTVIVLALEEKRAEVINHFRVMGGLDEPVHLHTGAAPDSTREGMAALANIIAMYQPVLVVVDPVFKLVRVKDSSDYAELTHALEPVIEMARQTGCHIAVTHHLGKMVREGGDDVLGSTAIFGAVDTLVLMRRMKDQRRTFETIQRYGKDVSETVVPMDEASGMISLGTTVSDLKVTEAKARVLEVIEKFADDYWGDTSTVREAAELQRAAVIKALNDLVEEGVIEVRGSGVRNDPKRYRLARVPDGFEIEAIPFSVPTYIPGTENRNTCSQCQTRELLPLEQAAGVCAVCANKAAGSW